MALRNQDMLMGGALFLLVFGVTLFLFIFKGYFAGNPLLALYILIGIAAIFNVIAVSIPFNPIEIAVDKSLIKNRFWLLKVMPLNGYKVFDIQCIMVLIPTYVLSLGGIIIFSAIRGMGLPVILLSGLSLLLILYGSVAIYTAVNMLFLERFYEKNRFVGNVLSLVLPVLYGIFSVGPLIVFFVKDMLLNIQMFSKVSNVLSLPAAAAVSVAIVIITFLISRRITAKAWDEFEM